MNLDQARKFIIRSIEVNNVTMLSGGPGIGKSSLMGQIADFLGRWLKDWRLAQCDPTDIRGIPVPNHETKRMEWYCPNTLPERGTDGLCVEGPGILFFDEIEKATTAVKNAALQIVLDRRVGDYLLPDDVAIVGAGNQEDDNCFSAPLGAALANRMLHAEVEHDIDVWIRWAYENKIEEDIIGYLQFEPINLYDNNGNNAFPSPRSWAMASKMIAGIENDSLIRTFITSAVGEGVANQFTAWSKVYKQVDTEAIVTRGIIPEMKVSDPGFNYAVAMAVAIYARKRGTKKYHNNIVKFLEMIGSDLQVVFFRQLEQETMVQFSKDPNFADIIKNIMDTFDI